MPEPTISVITISRNKEEIKKVKQMVDRQSYDDVHISASTKEGIPKAWNHALTKASGDIYLFTETDAVPIRNDWLECIANDWDLPERRAVHYGEIGRQGQGWDLSNFAVTAGVMDEFEFNEGYPIVEDTELFTRMDKAGVEFEKRFDNPVYHHPAPKRQKARKFKQGYYQTKCQLTYGQLGPSDELRHVPGNLNNSTDAIEDPSLLRLIVDQFRRPWESIIVDIRFLAGSALAIFDHMRGS